VQVRVEPRLTPGAEPASFYLAVAGAVVDRPLPEPAPVVVLVTSDTHRADHVGGPNLSDPNGGGPSGDLVRTPALDALAARGVVYEDCFAPSHITLPSHAALFTGASPRDTGVLDNNTALGAAAPTLAEAFRAAGWLTGAAVSLDILVDAHSGFGQGFERLSAPERTRRADETVAVALDWLESSRGRPLFLWVHLADAHAPYDPPDGAVGYPDGRDPFDPASALEGEAPHWLPEVRDVEYVRALYRGEVAYLDDRLGRLLEHPRARAGVVAVTADHGEVLGRHGIWWRHQDLYPDTLHVPLILAWPGAPAGTRVTEPVELVDLGRTLLDRAGLGGEPFPGRDLAAGGAPAPRFALSAGARSASVGSEGWHLILRLERPHELELYDLAGDPACELDRKQSEPARARALRATLVEWLDSGGPASTGWTGTRGEDPAVLARLAELGYTDLEVEAPAAPDGFAPPEDCPCAPWQTWR
jgi:arylsulfatase A-like enzyme